nr:hypothetical protein [Myxococcota bacterium]
LGKQAGDELRAALDSAAALQIGLATSTSERDNHAWIYVDSGREPDPVGRYPYDLRAMCRTPDDRPDAMVAWVELVHELVTTVDAAHGTILATGDEAILRSEVWAQHESRDGRELHPDPTLITSLAVRRSGLGDRWVRPPRWGTYLRAEHVAALGGRERLVSIVQPPVVRDVGALLYVQLSDGPDTALAPATLARQRAFAELLAGLIVPAV